MAEWEDPVLLTPRRLGVSLGTGPRRNLAEGPSGDRERGDVPGWVMITVRPAALGLALLIPFREAIVAAVTNALASVTTGG